MTESVTGMRDTRLVRTSVDGNPHTLVHRPPDDSRTFGPLFDLLPESGPNDVLVVTYAELTRVLQQWRERIDRRPRNVGIVGVGEAMRSTASADAPVRDVITGVADSTDAEAIRSAATAYLDAWPAEGRTVAYLDSMTELADRLGAEEAVAFLRAFRRALDARDAVGYVCLTPAAHDRRFVREVGSLFDTVVEYVDSAAELSARPSVDDCFEAIADPRRRSVLAALADDDGTPVADLADRVVARTGADRGRVAASLVDVHLPKLADLGVVAYDRGRDRVVRGDQFETVEPYLRRALDRPVSEE